MCFNAQSSDDNTVLGGSALLGYEASLKEVIYWKQEVRFFFFFFLTAWPHFLRLLCVLISTHWNSRTCQLPLNATPSGR